ncbi:formate--phosphoribosylaminoimidazolecarboxamide ligase [Candidatus Micrarchaeota archaeon]|nr:formate--phosphoribosylaminoimidazolecarboxamide ligase [Candidatus Micrarchaeota archaeon]
MAKEVKIATIGSHSALQILKGAHDEGFKTIAVTTPKASKVYESFGVADQIIEIDHFDKFASTDRKLVEENAVMIPHGSFTAHLSLEESKRMNAMYYGNRDILDWEFDRVKQREWLEAAGLRIPKNFTHAHEIDRPTIAKYYGARGGKGYFFAKTEKEFDRGIEKFGRSPLIIQEYIIGVPLYIHYFHSSLTGELEIMSMDKRYESNVDSLGRIPLKSQEGMEIDPSFVVVGNMPLVLRESLLAEAIEMGEKLVKASETLMGPKGLYGPFCLETIITPEQKFYIIEVSARIVAGTNCFIPNSPYTALRYDVPMTTGRRIALEIRRGIEQGRLEELVG